MENLIYINIRLLFFIIHKICHIKGKHLILKLDYNSAYQESLISENDKPSECDNRVSVF